MPTLNKKQITTVNITKESKKVIRQNYYNNQAWRRLRKYKLMMNPICEACGEALATAVHHIKSFVDEIDELKQMELFLDYDNLMSLCVNCHNEIHNQDLKRKKEKKKIKNF